MDFREMRILSQKPRFNFHDPEDEQGVNRFRAKPISQCRPKGWDVGWRMVRVNVTNCYNTDKPSSHQLVIVVAHVGPNALIIGAFHDLYIVELVRLLRTPSNER